MQNKSSKNLHKYATIEAFARTQINLRRAQPGAETDMCSFVVKANEDNDKSKLVDDEMVGDILAVLIAGHGMAF